MLLAAGPTGWFFGGRAKSKADVAVTTAEAAKTGAEAVKVAAETGKTAADTSASVAATADVIAQAASRVVDMLDERLRAQQEQIDDQGEQIGRLRYAVHQRDAAIRELSRYATEAGAWQQMMIALLVQASGKPAPPAPDPPRVSIPPDEAIEWAATPPPSRMNPHPTQEA